MPARRRFGLPITLGLCAGLLASAFLWLAASPAAEARAQAQTQASPCSLDIEETAWPAFLLRGETSRLDIRLQPNCSGGTPPLHLILVFDASSPLQGEESEQVAEHTSRLVEDLDLPAHPGLMVGTVTYDASGFNSCRLTREADRVLACVDRLRWEDRYGFFSRPDQGYAEALDLFRRARPKRAEPVLEVMVFFSGSPAKKPGEAMSAAEEVRRENIRVLGICIGAYCDSTLARIVRSDHDLYDVASAVALSPVLDDIRRKVEHPVLLQTDLSLELPANMAIVGNSILPPAKVPLDQQSILWKGLPITDQGVELTVELLPGAFGFQALTRSTLASFLDYEQRPGSAAGQRAWVQVFGPILQPRPW